MRHRLWHPSKQHNPEFGQSRSKVSLLQQFGRELVHIFGGNEGTRGHLAGGVGGVHDLTGGNGAARGGGEGLAAGGDGVHDLTGGNDAARGGGEGLMEATVLLGGL